MWGGRWGGGRQGLKTAEILLAESCRKQVSFESGFKQWKGRRISEARWQRVPDRRGKKAEGTLSEHNIHNMKILGFITTSTDRYRQAVTISHYKN